MHLSIKSISLLPPVLRWRHVIIGQMGTPMMYKGQKVEKSSLHYACLFVRFVALRPKRKAMVIAPNHTFSWASLNKRLTSAIYAINCELKSVR